MAETLKKLSSIWTLKSRFFIFRSVTYFFFLLFPIWAQKTLEVSLVMQVLCMLLYMSFMVGQWFLLGKEIDHRLKIYYKVNSSIDKVVYRLLLGMSLLIVYFNILSFLPHKWTYNVYWISWVVLGLFYSWPTRGKIIRESVSSHFGEFKFLDSFERTLLFLTVVIFFVSVPEIPTLNSIGGLKLYFDPSEVLSSHLWNFLSVHYIPFLKYSELLKLSWWLHFYFIGFGMILLTSYAIMRYFVSRRLALLGVFSIVSSWSIVKVMVSTPGITMLSSYSVLLFWTYLWSVSSSTYRSGFFIGLAGYLASIFGAPQFFMFLTISALVLGVHLAATSRWYKLQTLKYMLFGLVLGVIVVLFGQLTFSISTVSMKNFLLAHFERKAFYSLTFIGIFLLILVQFKKLRPKELRIDQQRMNQLFAFLGIGFIFQFFYPYFFAGLSTMWILALLSLIPVEWLFQKLSRQRSNRNLIYALYILIILLDSHFEERIKIVHSIFGPK